MHHNQEEKRSVGRPKLTEEQKEKKKQKLLKESARLKKIKADIKEKILASQKNRKKLLKERRREKRKLEIENKKIAREMKKLDTIKNLEKKKEIQEDKNILKQATVEFYKKEPPIYRGGRPRRHLEFEEARLFVRSQQLSSVGQYKKWWDLNKPTNVPKCPDRAYKKNFITWKDFLGKASSHNTFPSMTNYKKFEDAKIFAQGLKLKNFNEWLDWCKTGQRPLDIPARPDITYRSRGIEWCGWKDFLGNEIVAKIENLQAKKHYLIISKASASSPVDVYGVDNISCHTVNLEENLKNIPGSILAIYESTKNNFDIFIDSFHKPYWGDEFGNQKIIKNATGMATILKDNFLKIK